MIPIQQTEGFLVGSSDDLLIEGDVDIVCGNINAGGNIQVRGSVRQGYHVTAGGNVEVAGLIDGSSITAGGDIVIQGGIIGGKGSSVVAGGKISANFAQYAVLKGGGDITIKEMAMYSDVISSGRVDVLGRGVFIGGVAKAKEGFKAVKVGSSASVKTVIEVGLDPVIMEEVARLEDDIGSLGQKLEALQGEAHFLIEKLKLGIEFHGENLISNSILILDFMKKGRGSIPESAMGELHRLALSFFDAAKTDEKLRRCRAELQRFLQSREEGENAAVTIRGEVFPGVEIVICAKRINIETAKEGIQFYLSRGEIEERAL